MIYESSHNSKNNVSLLETTSPSNCIENKIMSTNKHCKQILTTSGHLGDNIQAENNKQSTSNMKHISHHVSIHSGEKQHEYTQCSKKRIKLKKNLMVHSGNRYKCSHCGQRFSRNDHLNVHLHIHSGEKPYKCTECGKKFTVRFSLKQHLLVHSGKKPHECTQCGKRFTQSDNLKRHMLVRSGEKQQEYTHCKKKRINLKKNLIVHSGDKYICSHCGQRFTQSGSLNVHLRIHSGEK